MDGAVLILGGRSEIGLEVATRLAPGKTVILAARRAHELTEETAAVRAAGALDVRCVEFDADATETHDELLGTLGPIATAVVAFGILGDQELAERDSAHAVAIIQTDFVAQVSVLTSLANIMRAAGGGDIVVFSSVAGVRVRRANYVYGSAKAGLDGFALGLSDALHGTPVRLLLVRPGFVVGRMTKGMKPAPLSSTPQQVADAVVRGLAGKRSVLWVPGGLRAMFAVARVVPAAIWRRMPR